MVGGIPPPFPFPYRGDNQPLFVAHFIALSLGGVQPPGTRSTIEVINEYMARTAGATQPPSAATPALNTSSEPSAAAVHFSRFAMHDSPVEVPPLVQEELIRTIKHEAVVHERVIQAAPNTTPAVVAVAVTVTTTTTTTTTTADGDTTANGAVNDSTVDQTHHQSTFILGHH